MMKPRGARAWWVAAFALALLAAGIASMGLDVRAPSGWAVMALAVAAIACALLAIRGRRAA